MANEPIAVGAIAPEFSLNASSGQSPLALSSLKGKIIVLAFYILDFTGGWTNELQTLQANSARFEELNAQVLGISVDSVFSHQTYAEQLGVTFPLLSDFHPKGQMVTDYGLWFEKIGTSKRAIVIVNEQGVVQHSKVFAKGLPDIEEVIAAVKAIGA